MTAPGIRAATDSTASSGDLRKRESTVRWVVLICAIAILFDGYDLVVYGTIVPTLLKDASHLGTVTPAVAGQLGSYALIGVLVGALTAGAISDHIGRRKLMLVNIAWFSIGMAATAFANSVAAFGILRFITGIGVGALVATAGAIVAEFAPPGRRNLYNAIVYCGVPAGGVMASLFAILFHDAIGWRGLFLVGATPILFLLPMAIAKLPESPLWLESRGRHAEAVAASQRTGIPLVAPEATGAPAAAPQATRAAKAQEKSGFAAIFSPRYLAPTIFLGFMSFAGLLLTYGLNTWLPVIMGQHGYNTSGSLLFLLTLNLGAIIGALLASRIADRIGPKWVIAGTFLLAAAALLILPFRLPFAVLLLLITAAGIGTIGTQVLVYGFVSNFYESRARGAGVAWCAGFGRLGGIFGPLIGGFLITAGISVTLAFQLFAIVAVFGALVTLLPRQPKDVETPLNPAKAEALEADAAVTPAH